MKGELKLPADFDRVTREAAQVFSLEERLEKCLSEMLELGVAITHAREGKSGNYQLGNEVFDVLQSTTVLAHMLAPFVNLWAETQMSKLEGAIEQKREEAPKKPVRWNG